MKLSSFPVIHTPRLSLRQATSDDCEAIFFLRSNDQVNKYIKRSTPNNLKEARDFLERISKEFQEGKTIFWSITMTGTQKMIGSICLWNFAMDRTIAEVGYDLSPHFQNQGVMSEALQVILSYGFKKLNLNEIEAFTHRHNESSKRLLLKNNFVLYENRKDENNPHNVIFGITSK